MKKREHRLQTLIHIAQNSDEPITNKKGPGRSFWRSVAAFSLNGEILEKFESLTDDFQNEWGDKVSRKFIGNSILDVISNLVHDANTDKAETYLTDLYEMLNTAPIEQIVYIPIVGIEVQEPLRIGQIRFIEMSSRITDEIIEKFKIVFQSTSNMTEQEQSFIDTQSADIRKALEGSVCAEYHIKAEKDRAQELAEIETLRALEIIRYSLPFLQRYNSWEYGIGFKAGDMLRSRTTIVTSKDYTHFTHGSTLTDRFRTLEITPTTVEKMATLGVFDLSALLDKSEKELNKFERTILRGIHWFVTSQTQSKLENRLLNLTICLETFFSPPNNDGYSIRKYISEAVALFVEDDFEARKKLKKRIKDTYDERSTIAHGNATELSLIEVRRLEYIVALVIKKLIEYRSKFRTRDEFLNWIDDLKLQGSRQD